MQDRAGFAGCAGSCSCRLDAVKDGTDRGAVRIRSVPLAWSLTASRFVLLRAQGFR